MARYNNRTLKRAGRVLASLDLGSAEAHRIGALIDTIEQEQARHKRDRERWLKALRKELDLIEGEKGGADD